MSKKISLHVDEMRKIIEQCERLGVARCEVIYKEGGGIGYYLYADYPIVQLNGLTGTFRTEITGVDSW